MSGVGGRDGQLLRQEIRRLRHGRTLAAFSAPQLVAAEAQALIIVTTALDGRPYPGPPTVAAHRQAGRILRRFHDVEFPRPLPGYRDWLRDRAA